MPTYEYRCPNGHEFDRFYKTMSTAATELPCPECAATASRQLSGGAGLHFKGSGFYLTDYGKNAHRKDEPKKTPAAEGGGSEGGKSEVKSESKKEPASKPSADAKPATPPKSETSKKPKSE